MRLKGKVAVITGAGSGMGKAMAKLFTSEGARVVCADISGNENVVAAALGEGAVPVHCDIAVEADVQRLIATAESKFGRLDILVNNAGFSGGTNPLHERTIEEWDKVHGINLRGTFLCMKYGVTSMLKTGAGSIVNISSVSGMVGWKHHSIYAAAKAGVLQLTKTAALDYANNNIRVNAVAPGTIWTGMVPLSKEHEAPPPGVHRIPGIPLDRWGLAIDIANAALFLASDEAAYITGAVLPVDGGYSIGFSSMGAENLGQASAIADAQPSGLTFK
jgi:NAD(P)-dependent dehydrogenase (short-subunit alcohol dehydrogenase family)